VSGKKAKDPLELMREQIRDLISKDYKTVEAFCWAKDLNKATISNFLRDKKDFQVSTLNKIAIAVGKKLTVRLD
jgi:hypothetical protein